MQYKRMVDEWEVTAQLIGGIGVAPIIKNINGLSVNAQIPENAVFEGINYRSSPTKSYNYQNIKDKFMQFF